MLRCVRQASLAVGTNALRPAGWRAGRPSERALWTMRSCVPSSEAGWAGWDGPDWAPSGRASLEDTTGVRTRRALATRSRLRSAVTGRPGCLRVLSVHPGLSPSRPYSRGVRANRASRFPAHVTDGHRTLLSSDGRCRLASMTAGVTDLDCKQIACSWTAVAPRLPRPVPFRKQNGV